MSKINRLICEIGLQRHKYGWAWQDCADELFERTGEELSDEAFRSRYRYWIGTYLEEEYGVPPEDSHRNQADDIQWKESSNRLTVGYTGKLISSLTELIEHLIQHGVDMSEWKVDKWEQKAYPVYCANRQADLTWSGGRIEYGTVHSDGDLTIRQVFTVHAEFVRTEPVAVRPVLQPVVLPLPEHHDPEPWRAERDTQRWLCAFDPHIGYKEKGPERKLIELHDRRALELFVRACELARPDGVVLGGDFLDLAEWSTHYVRNPHCVKMTQPALIEGLYWLARIRQAVGWDVPIIYEEGNHEVRIRHYLHKHVEHATELRGVRLEGVAIDGADLDIAIEERRAIGLPAWLHLDQLGIEWVEGYPDAAYWLSDNIRIEHGDRALVPGNTAKEQSKQSSVNVAFGHIHRRERVTHTVFQRGVNRSVTAVSPGGLMHTDGRLPGASPRDQWQQGFLEIDFDQDDSFIDPRFNVVAIQAGRAIYHGHRLEGTPARALHFLRHFTQYRW